MNNERFNAYYKAQKIIPDEEWGSFMDALRRPLPTTFRITGSREIAHTLGVTIQKTYVPLLDNVVFEGETIPPPTQIPWYPDGLAWQFNVSKKVLRKSPEFKKFHSFLVHETEVGNISRQEAVSMLPPLFMDVQPHHKVIDMCAAPGSKTAQLLEALHANDTATSTSIPPGLLIANDADGRRSHLLIHQSARLPSPAFMVTNLDASIYPVLKLPSFPNDNRRAVKKTSSQLLFDRILCDVPCSGDGTLRKNLGIWKRWQPMDGNGLHGLQGRILQRAMRMLASDGRIVYSTCSLNPVENEAVVAAALNLNPGVKPSLPEFELVDVSEQFPQLIRRPGLTTWSPTVDRTINTSFDSYDAYIQSLPEDKRSDVKLTETHWPPGNAETLHLERCMRIYPHLQDTGGFFVAIFERKTKYRTSNNAQAPKRTAEDADPSNGIPETKKLKVDTDTLVEEPEHECTTTPSVDTIMMDADALSTPEDKGKSAERPPDVGSAVSWGQSALADPSFKEMPFTFLAPDDPALLACIKQLNLTTSFPSSDVLVRNPAGEPVRSFYLTNSLVKSVIQANDYTRMRLMASGTKVVTKQEAARGMDAQYRVLGEGLPVVLPYIKSEVIMSADFGALKALLQNYYPLCASFGEPFRSEIEARGPGSHIVRFLAETSMDTTLSRDLVLPLWKSNVSISLMIDKKAKSALSLRLFGEDLTVAAREQSKKKNLAGSGTGAEVLVVGETRDSENDRDAENDGHSGGGGEAQE
ncbi:S-adenosyl-L-methionine-dependent methyltransferase [Pisolithus thermaeus]|nr:S-adenosyl-L-methionine-dependent methyltransferase [Pisolithus thermaeus]